MYFHLHHINRKEAKDIGLKIKCAEEFTSGSVATKDLENLEHLIWDLYLDYERDLLIHQSYRDELPTTGDIREIPLKFIESTVRSSQNILEQRWTDMGFPEGTYLSNINGALGVFIPPHLMSAPQPSTGLPQSTLIGGQVVAIQFQAPVVYINERIYEKREATIWR